LAVDKDGLHCQPKKGSCPSKFPVVAPQQRRRRTVRDGRPYAPLRLWWPRAGGEGGAPQTPSQLQKKKPKNTNTPPPTKITTNTQNTPPQQKNHPQKKNHKPKTPKLPQTKTTKKPKNPPKKPHTVPAEASYLMKLHSPVLSFARAQGFRQMCLFLPGSAMSPPLPRVLIFPFFKNGVVSLIP